MLLGTLGSKHGHLMPNGCSMQVVILVLNFGLVHLEKLTIHMCIFSEHFLVKFLYSTRRGSCRAEKMFCLRLLCRCILASGEHWSAALGICHLAEGEVSYQIQIRGGVFSARSCDLVSSKDRGTNAVSGGERQTITMNQQ